MINTKDPLKVMAAWVTIVYVVCFVSVAVIPEATPWFLRYGLHMNITMAERVTSPTTFVSGLIIWNVIAFLGTWLFTVLHNTIRK